ncbi:MAG: TonB-dependent receptor, partial [Bacteroidota bacterium]
MKSYISIFSFILCLLSTNFLSAQGTIRGNIKDAATGESLLFANIVVDNSDPLIGTQSDLDGNFELTLAAGTYAVTASYTGYPDKTIQEIVVSEGEIMLLDFLMEEAAIQATEEAIVITATTIDRTENALLSLQRKALTIQDGISAQEISRFGSSNAAESMKRVTGASVVGGKYIYVRGLGDRYSAAQLNGIPLPSTDPYRNSTQLDLIPSNLLDNIVASKTFSPDQPGNFTGGNVNIKTKSFPERFTLSASVGVTYNTVSSFNDNFLSYEGGSTDWLGYDDGTREIPAILTDEKTTEALTTSSYITARRDDALAATIDETSKSLSPQKEPDTIRSGLNQNLAISIGNQFSLKGDSKLGVLAGFNYRREFNAYNNGRFSNWERPGVDAPELNTNFDLDATSGTETPTVGGLFNLSYKFAGSQKISFNALYNHTADKTATFRQGQNLGIIAASGLEFQTRALLFTERGLESYQLLGEHVIPALKNTKIEWGVSQVSLFQREPDLRFFANTFNPTNDDEDLPTYFISPSEYDLPFHYWRDLQDEQQLAKVDITIPFAQGKSTANKFKVGFMYAGKTRDFVEERFQIQTKSNRFERYTGDADAFFAPSNTGLIGQTSNGQNTIGLYVTDEKVVANDYMGEEIVTAAYGMFTYDLNQLRITAGARVETTDFTVESADENKAIGRIDEVDLLPSLNLVYRFSDKTNLRASFTQTLARPNMREVAPFSLFDFIGAPLFTGNPELERTLATNLDLRWELYPSPGEMVAISTYYKDFTDPIVFSFIPESQNPEIKPVNVPEAIVYGVEVEFRKNLDFISEKLSNFKVFSNVSFIQSSVDIVEDELAAIRTTEPDFPETRPFQGQSPFLVNAGLNFYDYERGIDALLSFNVFGERLAILGNFQTPDVYEQPIPQLDFSFKKTFAERYTIRFSAQNLLNS